MLHQVDKANTTGGEATLFIAGAVFVGKLPGHLRYSCEKQSRGNRTGSHKLPFFGTVGQHFTIRQDWRMRLVGMSGYPLVSMASQCRQQRTESHWAGGISHAQHRPFQKEKAAVSCLDTGYIRLKHSRQYKEQWNRNSSHASVTRRPLFSRYHNPSNIRCY